MACLTHSGMIVVLQTRWMKDPVPLSQISGYFSCKIVGLAKPCELRVWTVSPSFTKVLP